MTRQKFDFFICGGSKVILKRTSVQHRMKAIDPIEHTFWCIKNLDKHHIPLYHLKSTEGEKRNQLGKQNFKQKL